MRTSFLLAMTAATILAGMAAGSMAISDATPANPIREAAMVCGNVGCYRPQVQKIEHRKFQPLGQPIVQPPVQPLVHG
jgi:hypothetical protein